jgi:hypothetical protein
MTIFGSAEILNGTWNFKRHSSYLKPTDERRPQRTMNLPPEIQFHQDIRLLVYRPHGLLNEAAFNKVLGALEDLEAKLQEPFNRFLDTVAADEVELNFKYIIQASLHRRLSYAGRPPVKSAILATDSTIIHYGRLHAVLTQGSPIKVRIFQDRKEAAEWLGVPIDRITTEAAGRQPPGT